MGGLLRSRSSSRSLWPDHAGLEIDWQHILGNPQKWKGALVSEDALHFDGDKPNSVSRLRGGTMIIYLAQLAPDARPPIAGRNATIPEDLADRLPFLCFVLHRMGFFLPRALRRER